MPIPIHRQCPEFTANELSPEAFVREFVAPSQPVIIRGGMKDWPALERWPEPGYLENAFGDKPVPITHIRDAQPTIHPMAMNEFLGHLRSGPAEPGETEYCLVERPITVRGQARALLGEVADDIEVPPYMQGMEHIRACLFAARDIRTACHYHPGGEAMLCQVVGRKRVLCFDPAWGHFRALYPRQWFRHTFNFSQIRFPRDGSIPDPEQYPRFARARAVECVLEPGDMLYIPIFWRHLAFSIGMSLSVAHFCIGEARKRYFTPIGLRSNYLNARLLRYFMGKLTGNAATKLAE